MGTAISTKASRVESLQQLQPGDHIRYPRSTSAKPAADHHAIVTECNDTGGITVIYRVGDPPRIVEEAADVRSLVEAGRLWRYDYATDECFHPEFVIRRARTQLVLPPDHGLLGQNSEYFARWSKNANEVSYKALYITIAVAAVIVTIAVIYAKYTQVLSRDEL